MELKVPYHGAKDVHICVKNIMAAIPDNSKLPMSVNVMVKVLIEDGMNEALAKKLASQIRKGAGLCVEWKEAFDCGKFTQKLGRSTEASENQIVRKIQNIRAKTDPAGFKLAKQLQLKQQLQQQRSEEEKANAGMYNTQDKVNKKLYISKSSSTSTLSSTSPREVPPAPYIAISRSNSSHGSSLSTTTSFASSIPSPPPPLPRTLNNLLKYSSENSGHNSSYIEEYHPSMLGLRMMEQSQQPILPSSLTPSSPLHDSQEQVREDGRVVSSDGERFNYSQPLPPSEIQRSNSSSNVSSKSSGDKNNDFSSSEVGRQSSSSHASSQKHLSSHTSSHTSATSSRSPRIPPPPSALLQASLYATSRNNNHHPSIVLPSSQYNYFPSSATNSSTYYPSMMLQDQHHHHHHSSSQQRPHPFPIGSSRQRQGKESSSSSSSSASNNNDGQYLQSSFPEENGNQRGQQLLRLGDASFLPQYMYDDRLSSSSSSLLLQQQQQQQPLSSFSSSNDNPSSTTDTHHHSTHLPKNMRRKKKKKQNEVGDVDGTYPYQGTTSFPLHPYAAPSSYTSDGYSYLDQLQDRGGGGGGEGRRKGDIQSSLYNDGGMYLSSGSMDEIERQHMMHYYGTQPTTVSSSRSFSGELSPSLYSSSSRKGGGDSGVHNDDGTIQPPSKKNKAGKSQSKSSYSSYDGSNAVEEGLYEKGYDDDGGTAQPPRNDPSIPTSSHSLSHSSNSLSTSLPPHISLLTPSQQAYYFYRQQQEQEHQQQQYALLNSSNASLSRGGVQFSESSSSSSITKKKKKKKKRNLQQQSEKPSPPSEDATGAANVLVQLCASTSYDSGEEALLSKERDKVTL